MKKYLNYALTFTCGVATGVVVHQQYILFKERKNNAKPIFVPFTKLEEHMMEEETIDPSVDELVIFGAEGTDADDHEECKLDPLEEIFEEVPAEIENEPFEVPFDPSQKYDIPPYEISQETFASPEPKFKKVVLWYTAPSGDFVMNDGSVLDNIDECIGPKNLITFFESDNAYMYVRNEKLGIDYELISE